VVEPGLFFRHEMATWISHGAIVADRVNDVDQKIT